MQSHEKEDPENWTHSDTEIENPNLTEYQTEDGDEQEEQAPLTRHGLVAALRKGVREGILTKQQAEQIKAENFIFQSEFTHSPRDKKKEKAKRKAQKRARKITLGKGRKGQKNTKGKRFNMKR